MEFKVDLNVYSASSEVVEVDAASLEDALRLAQRHYNTEVNEVTGFPVSAVDENGKACVMPAQAGIKPGEYSVTWLWFSPTTDAKEAAKEARDVLRASTGVSNLSVMDSSGACTVIDASPGPSASPTHLN